MRIFERRPKFNNDLFGFILFLLAFFGVVCSLGLIVVTFNEARLRLNPYVLCFFYGVFLGYLGAKIK